jgi:predicted MFS family arabinose efflux permease
VWQRPALLGGLSMAFLINLLAFPLFIGLLPYLAKNIYGVGQAGLGWLGASFAFGALLGSLLLSSNRLRVGAARLMLMSGLAWLLVNVVQAQTTDMLSGMACLMLSGFVQSLCMTPLAAVMLRATEPAYRGRVMGIRILGILGLPLGLMLAGPLIQQWGFQITMTAYAICGILLTLAMALYWRQVLWLDDKPI